LPIKVPIDLPIETAVTWIFKLAVGIMYLLEAMFFIGIVGCASVVVFSLISILKDGFSKDR
jgi:hypothetical protein